jgi:hypothetical protein
MDAHMCFQNPELAADRIATLEADLKAAWDTNRAIDKARMEDRVKWQKDAERLDWLESNPRHAQTFIDGVPRDCVFYGISCSDLTRLRDAIDAAMEA